MPQMCELDWQTIANAPFGHDLEVAVVEGTEAHRLIVPCRRTPTGWINAATGRRLDVHPTHWRYWPL